MHIYPVMTMHLYPVMTMHIYPVMTMHLYPVMTMHIYPVMTMHIYPVMTMHIYPYIYCIPIHCHKQLSHEQLCTADIIIMILAKCSAIGPFSFLPLTMDMFSLIRLIRNLSPKQRLLLCEESLSQRHCSGISNLNNSEWYFYRAFQGPKVAWQTPD
jgi:hypothetical protein